MNPSHQALLEYFEKAAHLTEDERAALIKVVKEADRALTISEFKLDRTEKVKRTTAILLEETIEELEQKRAAIEQTNAALSKSLEELKAAQTQLIHAEKMASLGELTAGIAHEIQNPLNFVNNFSEVSKELLEEMKEELEQGNLEEVQEIAADVISNLEKILHHGKRADGIVKGMLMHSRANKGEKEATDINALVDEYLRLAYHGLRAKDKSFSAKLETDFDNAIGSIEIVPQDIGRVILNLITNAFYACAERSRSAVAERSRSAVAERSRSASAERSRSASAERSRSAVKKPHPPEYEPTVWVRTRQSGDQILISVEDNGNGIPEEIVGKIFQPFFTTKPTGQGTGLGLSLSYDIVKAHHGELMVQTKENAGTTFTIQLPLKN